MEKCCLLACSHGLLRQLSYTTQDHLLRGGPTHSELDPPTSMVNQESAPWTCFPVSLMKVVPQLSFSSQMTLACQADKTRRTRTESLSAACHFLKNRVSLCCLSLSNLVLCLFYSHYWKWKCFFLWKWRFFFCVFHAHMSVCVLSYNRVLEFVSTGIFTHITLLFQPVFAG